MNGTKKVYQHYCSAENAARFADWIRNRGGVAVWKSIDLSSPDNAWSTPALDAVGKNFPKPSYKATSEPVAIYTDPEDIGVVTLKEYRRFHVALRMGGNGLSVKLTDGSNHRLNKTLAAAGEGATYQFDYDTQEAVVLKPAETISLKDWMFNHIEEVLG